MGEGALLDRQNGGAGHRAGTPALSLSVRSLAALLALAVVFGWASHWARVTLLVNLTGSLPIGLYRRVPGVPARGDLTIACLPPSVSEFAVRRRYVWRGKCAGGAAPIGKRVLAVSGDTVQQTAEGLVLNGRPVPNSRVASQDSRGRPIPHPPFGRHILRATQVWLFSPYHPLSFDSRYFGPVDATSLQGRISPVLVVQGGRRFF